MADDFDLKDRLEPLVAGMGEYTHAPLYSIAISLKRIADAISTTPTQLGIVDHLAAVLDNASHNHAQRMNQL